MNGRYPRTGLLSFSYHSPPFPETILTGAQKFVKAELGHFPFQDSSLIKQKLYICLISCFQVLQNPKYDWSENNIKPITDYPAYYICNDICNIRRPETVDEWLQYFNPQTHQKAEKYRFAKFGIPALGQWKQKTKWHSHHNI